MGRKHNKSSNAKASQAKGKKNHDGNSTISTPETSAPSSLDTPPAELEYWKIVADLDDQAETTPKVAKPVKTKGRRKAGGKGGKNRPASSPKSVKADSDTEDREGKAEEHQPDSRPTSVKADSDTEDREGKAEEHQPDSRPTGMTLASASMYAGWPICLSEVPMQGTFVLSNWSKDELHNCVAVDCENYKINGVPALGRVSVVDHEGNVLLDTFVRHDLPPSDFMTQFSGIRPENLTDAPHFSEVRMRVKALFQGKIVVGHDLYQHFGVLGVDHPTTHLRDTASHTPLKFIVQWTYPGNVGLKYLARTLFGENIQTGEHCSITDSRMAMKVYCRLRKVTTDMQSCICNQYPIDNLPVI